MAVRRWRERIRDILNAVAEVEVFTQGMTGDQFLLDHKTIRAVELNFIIIGEATSQVPDDVQGRFPEVPWRIMKAMRNRLVHVYFDADPRIVWETIVNDLPPLVVPLRRLLAENPERPADEPLSEPPSQVDVRGERDETK